MLVAAYATETVVDLADSQCAAAFRFLAFRFLGMDRRGSGFRVSLRSGFFNASARSPRRQSLRTLDICVDANGGFQFCENKNAIYRWDERENRETSFDAAGPSQATTWRNADRKASISDFLPIVTRM